MADGAIVGQVGVRVRPELDRFRREVESGLRKATAGLKAEIPIDISAAQTRVRLEKALRRGTAGVKVEVPVDFIPSVAILRARLQALVDTVVAGVEAEVPVTFNTKNMPKLGNGLGGGGGGSPGSLLRDIAKYGTAAGLALGALANSVPALASVWVGLTQLAGAAYLLPGALVAAGAAFATIKVATAGFSDALKGDEEALKKLSPAARQTVQALKGLEGQWTKLR